MRFSNLFLLGFSVLVIAGIIGCGSASVADLGGEKISLKEFEEVYAKNNGGLDAAKKTSAEDRQNFLDLYVKFKLKVKEARSLGYDKDPELVKELADYRKNLAVSYMLEKEITGPALQTMYNRRLKEVRASHILIRLQESPSPAETLAAYTKAMKIIDSLKAGLPFETIALNNSEDPSVQNNKGDLYYFTAGAMVPEFEDAVFSIPVGTFSTTPTRTVFGYHIIKVVDVKPNQGSVNVSHIMKRLTASSTAEDSAHAKAELLGVLDSVKNKGGDFGEIAKTLSDDTFSAQRGGNLGFITRGRTIRDFDSVVFAMKDGEVRGIVTSPFGFHLIKRIATQPVPAFKDAEQEMKTEYQRSRFQGDYDKMVAKVKAMYNFKQDSAVVAAFSAAVDTAMVTGETGWDSLFTKELRARAIFTFNNQKVTVANVIEAVNTNPELRNISLKLPTTVPTILEKVSKNAVMEAYALSLENSFPDFAKTMKEYEEGILLFKAEQENVWNKVAPSDSALRKYYAENKSKYQWGDRVSVQEIFVNNENDAKLVQKALRGYTVDSLVVDKKKSKGKKVVYDTLKIAVSPIAFDSAAALYNKRAATLDKRGVWELQAVTTSEVTKRAWDRQVPDTLAYTPIEGGFHFIKVLQRDPAREKTFEEASSEVSSAFQEYETKRLSDTWYETLKKKYNPVVNKETVQKAFSAQ